MKKIVKQAGCIFMIGMVLFAGVTGCGQKGNSFAYAEDKDAPVSTTLVGSVVTAEGNTFTLSVGETRGFNGGGSRGERGQKPEGELPEGEMPQMPEGELPEGEMPQMPEGEMPKGEMPQMPEGEMPEREMPQMPEGKLPEGEMPQMPEGGMFPGSEESEAVLTIQDESVIKVMSMTVNEKYEPTEETEDKTPPADVQTSAAGSLADIIEGARVTISFDEAGEITEITVMKFE